MRLPKRWRGPAGIVALALLAAGLILTVGLPGWLFVAGAFLGWLSIDE